MAGVFISRGMTVGIPAGGLVVGIGEDGKPTASVKMHLHFDVCPTWLEIAVQPGKPRNDDVQRYAAALCARLQNVGLATKA